MTRRREKPCDCRGRGGVMGPQLATPGATEAGRGRKDQPPSLPGGHGPATPGSHLRKQLSDAWLPAPVRITFSCSKLPGVWGFVTAAPGHRYLR